MLWSIETGKCLLKYVGHAGSGEIIFVFNVKKCVAHICMEIGSVCMFTNKSCLALSCILFLNGVTFILDNCNVEPQWKYIMEGSRMRILQKGKMLPLHKMLTFKFRMLNVLC